MREDIENDDLLKELFQQSASVPSEDLKEKIMQRIAVRSEVFQYQPVIGKKSWIVIACSFIGLIAYLLIKDSQTSFKSMEELMPNLDSLTNWKLPGISWSAWMDLQLLEVPYPVMISMGALIIFGIYFMVSFRFSRNGGGL